jgi:hypothetical protein
MAPMISLLSVQTAPNFSTSTLNDSGGIYILFGC